MGYGRTARVLHWLTVLLVLVLVPAGMIMTQELPRATQNLLFMLHKGLGPVLFVLVAIRLVWRFVSPPPPLPAATPAIQIRVAGAVHAALYGLLIVMAVSGYVRVMAGGFPIELLDSLGIPPLIGKNEWLASAAKAIHATAILGLMPLIFLHIGAAAYHGVVKRDGVFQRMWPPLGRR